LQENFDMTIATRAIMGTTSGIIGWALGTAAAAQYANIDPRTAFVLAGVLFAVPAAVWAGAPLLRAEMKPTVSVGR
jgi:predicted MFS family arabinose efflux permease